MLLASFVFLSVIESGQADLNNKNIWFVYFADPKNSSLDFAIENHSENSNFHWEIFVNKIKVQESDVTISKGETKTIPVSAKDIQGKKITIAVTGDNKKEVYKNL